MLPCRVALLRLIQGYLAITSRVGAVVPPLSVGGPSGNRLFDTEGKEIRLACVNWYGAHMERFVVNGLDSQPLQSIVDQISNMSFNCVRLVFSNELMDKNPTVIDAALEANPSLVGKRALPVFDATVEALTSSGIMVVLNNHISKAGWCCSKDDGEGLWHTEAYPSDQWQQMWIDLALRYAHNSFVIGADLRNELRTASGISPEWGSGKNGLDWKKAAQACGDAVLSANPHLLIIVEALDFASTFVGEGKDSTSTRYVEQFPIVLRSPGKLVYSGHVYPWFHSVVDTSSYAAFHDKLLESLLYVTTPGKNYTTYFWLSEFGDNRQSQTWKLLMQLLHENPHIGWSYWALDGYKTPGDDETYGLLNADYETIRHDWKLQDLRGIMSVLPSRYIPAPVASESNSVVLTIVVLSCLFACGFAGWWYRRLAHARSLARCSQDDANGSLEMILQH